MTYDERARDVLAQWSPDVTIRVLDGRIQSAITDVGALRAAIADAIRAAVNEAVSIAMTKV